jgi:hypothetical protein
MSEIMQIKLIGDTPDIDARFTKIDHHRFHFLPAINSQDFRRLLESTRSDATLGGFRERAFLV